MKIIYGVSGEGLGHIFEAIEIVNFLKLKGHTVKILTYGDRACDKLQSLHPTRIEGFILYFNSKGLSLITTLFKNFRIIPFYIKNYRRLKQEFIAFNPDVFISAYEPFTTITSHLFHKPLISMDNQHELLYLKKPRNVSMFNFKLVQWATRICTYGATYYIVKSFNKIKSNKKNIYFVSPIIQNETRSLSPSNGNHILVYLTKPNPDLICILKSIPEAFIIYCNNKILDDHNIIYRASGPNYLQDLSGCKAIIGTTGFSLIADSIYLKKPYFGVPLKKQFEQLYNAYFLRQSGLGEFSENATKKELELFFDNLQNYKDNLAQYHFDPTEQEEVLEILLKKIENDQKKTSNLL